MGLKVENVLCWIVVGLLDLRARGQSDDTSTERRGVFGDLRLGRFLQSGEEISQCRWCVVSGFVSLSLSLSLWAGVLVCGCRLPSSDRNKLGFLWFFTAKVTDSSKNCFKLFLFFDKFHRRFVMRWSYAQKPLFFHSEESLSTDNIRWMLSWTLVGIIILCVR